MTFVRMPHDAGRRQICLNGNDLVYLMADLTPEDFLPGRFETEAAESEQTGQDSQPEPVLF